MNDLRPLFRNGLAIVVVAIVFQITASVFLVNLPPIRVYALSSAFAVVVIAVGLFIRRRSAARHSPSQQEENR